MTGWKVNLLPALSSFRFHSDFLLMRQIDDDPRGGSGVAFSIEADSRCQ